MFEVETLFLICIMLLPIVTGAYTFYKSFKVVEEDVWSSNIIVIFWLLSISEYCYALSYCWGATMMLYLESQLEKAYRVYVLQIPLGQPIPDIEFFRTMMEELDDPTYFEELLNDWDELDETKRNTH